MSTALLLAHKAGFKAARFIVPLGAKLRPYVDTLFLISKVVGFRWALPVCVLDGVFPFPKYPVEPFSFFLAGGPQVDAIFSTVTTFHSFLCKQYTNKSL